MGIQIRVLHLNNHCTLEDNHSYLTIEGQNEMLVIDMQPFQSILTRDRSNEEYSYIPPFFRIYTDNRRRSDIVVHNRASIRVIKTSKAKIENNEVLLPSIFIDTSSSTVKWTEEAPRSFKSFELNLPCYMTQKHIVLPAQNVLLDISANEGTYVICGKNGFGLFQTYCSDTVALHSSHVDIQFYNNSHKTLDMSRRPPVFGYSDGDETIIGYQDGFEFKKTTLIRAPGIQSLPFFFIVNGVVSMSFFPLTTPLCIHLWNGRLLLFTPEKELHVTDLYKTANSMYWDIRLIHIMRNDRVAAIYMLSFEKNDSKTKTVNVYRLNNHFLLEQVYSLGGIKWLDNISTNEVMVQDSFYMLYRKEADHRGQSSYGLLVLTEDEVYHLDIGRIGRKSPLIRLIQFWPSPNVAVLYTSGTFLLIHKKDVIEVDVKLPLLPLFPLFCAGKKLYVFDEDGKKDVYFIDTLANNSSKKLRATLLWDDNGT